MPKGSNLYYILLLIKSKRGLLCVWIDCFTWGLRIYRFTQFGTWSIGICSCLPLLLSAPVLITCFSFLAPTFIYVSVVLISTWNFVSLLPCSRKVNNKRPLHVCMINFSCLMFFRFFCYSYQFSGAKCTFSGLHTSVGETTDGHSNFHRLAWCWNQKHRLHFLHWKRTSENPSFSVCSGWTNKHFKGELITTSIQIMT